MDFALPADAFDVLELDPLDTVDQITAVSGAWALSSGVLRGTGAAYIYARHTREVHRPLAFVEVDVRVPATATGEIYGGPVGRWNGTGTTVQLQAMLARTSTVAGNPFTHLRLARGGAASQTIALPTTIPVDTWARVGALISHAGIVGFVNGEAIATMVEPPTSGLGHRIGLSGGAGSLGPEFRNLRILGSRLPTFVPAA